MGDENTPCTLGVIWIGCQAVSVDMTRRKRYVRLGNHPASQHPCEERTVGGALAFVGVFIGILVVAYHPGLSLVMGLIVLGAYSVASIE